MKPHRKEATFFRLDSEMQKVLVLLEGIDQETQECVRTCSVDCKEEKKKAMFHDSRPVRAAS
jgi:hypothetical protein